VYFLPYDTLCPADWRRLSLAAGVVGAGWGVQGYVQIPQL